MPGISDPGTWLASAVIEAGIAVFPIPGANAALSALVASGLPTGEFHFLGFLPEKAGARRTRIETLAAAGEEAGTLVFYEAPHRILDTLADVYGGNQNDMGQARLFVQYCLGRLARKIGGAVFVCAHPSQAGMNTGAGTNLSFDVLPFHSALLIDAASGPARAGPTRQTSATNPASQRFKSISESPSDKDLDGVEFLAS